MGIQYLRAIAAFSVLLYHASYYVASARGDWSLLGIFGAEFGDFGVTVFFAISGFLMASLAPRSTPAIFLVHRLIRIYPIYWIVAGACLLVRHVLREDAVFDVMAFALVPGGPHHYVLGVEWTLPFELTYYVVVFSIIGCRLQRALPLLAVTWIAAISAALRIAPNLQMGQFPTIAMILLSEKSIAFAAGLLIPAAIKRGLVGSGVPLVGFAMVLGSEVVPTVRPWLFCLGCTALVAGAATLQRRSSGRSTDIGHAFGDWSFALYLCHVPLIIWVCQVVPASVPSIALWFTSIGAALGMTVIIGVLDMRLYRQMKRQVDRAPIAPIRAIGGAFIVTIGFLGAQGELDRLRNQRVVAAANVLGGQIEAASASGLQADILAAAEALPLRRDDAIRGNVDVLTHDLHGDLGIQGWVFDRAGGGDRAAVLVFLDGRFVGAFAAHLARPDVLAAFAAEGSSALPGVIIKAKSPCRADEHFALLAVSVDRRFAPISAVAEHAACARHDPPPGGRRS